MDSNYQNMLTTFLRLLLVSVMLFAGIGCDSLLPDEFKAKNFNAADIDIKAGALLTRDTINNSQGNTVSYQYYPITAASYRILDTTWAFINSKAFVDFSFVDSTTRANNTDNQIILLKGSTLIDSLQELISDTLLLVRYPANQKTTYAILKSNSSKDIYIYTSLQYYSDNINEYVSIDLIKEDTSLASTSSEVSPETAYHSFERILVGGISTIVPVISARYTAHLNQGVYFIRFTLSNPQTISNPQAVPKSSFGLPSIARQFKVVILSF